MTKNTCRSGIPRKKGPMFYPDLVMIDLFMLLTSLLTADDQCDVFLVASNRASLMSTDSARRMKEAKRFMWMLFLMQCSFLINNSVHHTSTRVVASLPVYILR